MSLTEQSRKDLEDRRKNQIQRAAKKLFYENGYTATSMDAVAREAGISKGLIYHYFQNKEELLLSFSGELEDYLSDLKTEASPEESLRRFGEDFLVTDPERFSDVPPIQILLTTFADQQFDISKYQKQNPILRDFGREYLGQFFEKGISEGIFRKGDPGQFGDICWSFLMGKLLPVKKGNESQKPEVYVEEILSIFRKENSDGD